MPKMPKRRTTTLPDTHQDVTARLRDIPSGRVFDIRISSSEAMYLWEVLEQLVYSGAVTVPLEDDKREHLRWVHERLARTVIGNPFLKVE